MDVSAKEEIISLNVDKRSPRKVFTLPAPNRLVVDVPSSGGHKGAALPAGYNGKLLKQVRFGQFDPRTSRFVFDLAHAIKVTSVSDEDGKLIIRIAAAEVQNEQVISDKAQKSQDKSEAKKQVRLSKSIKTVAKSDKPLIVIDPGHGGVDPGTIGATGTQEKDITLMYAKALKEKLQKSGRYHVKLTHEDDRFIMLRKRVDIARAAGASLFISLHADSAPEQSARGLSIYTLSEQASDKETAALASRENKSDVLAGMDLSEESEDVAGILISLAERETKNRSATLADFLVTRLDRKVPLLSNPHRFAGFAVLKAPDIPAVLVEIGFLSHPKEEALLKSKAYRDKVTGGITEGIDAYFRYEKN